MHHMDQKRPVVEFSNVTKRLFNFEIRSISLTLHAGEVHALTGENGSGKSALLHLLSDHSDLDTGSLTFPEHGDALFVSYVEQDVQTFDNLSVAENVFFNRFPKVRGIPFLIDRPRMFAECRTVFAGLDIPLIPETVMGTLGFAERQLVTSARAYVDDAPISVFDVPTSAMNDIERAIVLNIIEHLAARGTGVFLVTHRVDEILQAADRVSVMEQGELVQTRSVSDMSRADLVHMMAGTIHTRGYPRIFNRSGPPIMKVRNLASPPALTNVSFDLRRGEILGITGLMGSGRTRLAWCLFGLLRPTSGTILIDDREVRISDPSDAMAQGIALIPEDPIENGIFSDNNLVFNVTLAALHRFVHNHTLNSEYMRYFVNQLVTNLDIKTGNEMDRVGLFSGGNQQKVLVARWLATRTKICIMDEPTRGSDIAARVDIYNAINDLVSSGVSVILISSEIEEILGMSDRILVLAGGRIAAEMDRSVATKERIIACATDNE